jgi:hypothetical protein
MLDAQVGNDHDELGILRLGLDVPRRYAVDVGAMRDRQMAMAAVTLWAKYYGDMPTRSEGYGRLRRV